MPTSRTMERIAGLAAIAMLAGLAAQAQSVNGYLPQAGPVVRSVLMPFVRVEMDPHVFPVGLAAQQFAISKPPAANSYRLVNPCDVDIRIRKVSGMSESVTATTGTRYLACTTEVVGTSSPEFISVIAVSAPSSPCSVELQYGDGS